MFATTLPQKQEININKSTSFNEAVVNFSLIEEVEQKLINLFNYYKELDIPVFSYISPRTPKKLAYFLVASFERSFAIGIAGETASGKSTMTEDIIEIIERFEQKHDFSKIITRVNTDDYYYDRSDMVKAAGSFENFVKNYDLDIPDAFELNLLKKHVKELVAGKEVWLPRYDMSGTAKRYNNAFLAEPTKIIISEGLYNLNDEVREAFDLSIFVDVSADIRKDRWYRRAKNRGLEGKSADRVYNNASDKAEIYIKPSMKNADIVMNGDTSREAYKDFLSKFLGIVEFIHFKKLTAV